MSLTSLRILLRPTVERITGGLQGRIYRAARRAIRRSSGDLSATLVLPHRCGYRLPERVVEILLAHRTYQPGIRILDIGHANIMECHRRFLASLPRPRRITGIDIADPVYDTTRYYERSVKGDMVASGLPDASFDLIWCISTLEHIGMDNSGYTAVFTTGEHRAGQAVREMVRLLVPGGQLLLTVPYGQYENFGWQINYDAVRWHAVLDPMRAHATVRTWYFHHGPNGWSVVPPEALVTVRYHDQQNAGAAGMAAALITRHRK